MKKRLESIFTFQYCWHWMLWLYLLLPASLFLLGWIGGNSRFGGFLSTLYDSYGTYILNPVPDFHAATGIVGLALPLVFWVIALVRRRNLDLLACIGIFAVNFLFYWIDGFSFFLGFLSL